MEPVLKNPFDDVASACATIPHLDLLTEFEHGPLYAEFDRLHEATWRPYQTRFAPLQALLAASWHGASLVGPNGSVYDDLTEKVYENGQTYSITELGEKCPAMMKVVETLGGETSRCRVMIVKAGGRINWHSHMYDGVMNTDPNKKYEIVVHVPIIAPHGFKYSVMSVQDYRTKDFEREQLTLYNSNYPPGHAWMFNSVHMHAVFNPTPHDRVSIMMYLNLKNIKTFNIVSNAVYRYKGVHIDNLS